MLWDGLEELGIQCLVDKENRLASLTTPLIPDGVDGKAVSTYLLQNYNIEIFPAWENWQQSVARGPHGIQ